LEIFCKEDKINRNKRGDNEDNERVKELGRQIDQMVYKLYGLTPEEIKHSTISKKLQCFKKVIKFPIVVKNRSI